MTVNKGIFCPKDSLRNILTKRLLILLLMLQVCVGKNLCLVRESNALGHVSTIKQKINAVHLAST